jgi:hypothetical protein
MTETGVREFLALLGVDVQNWTGIGLDLKFVMGSGRIGLLVITFAYRPLTRRLPSGRDFLNSSYSNLNLECFQAWSAGALWWPGYDERLCRT